MHVLIESPPLLVVVGMNSEAKLARRLGRVAVGAAGLAEALRVGASGVLSFGLCGALDPDLAAGDLVIGTEVAFGETRLAADATWGNRLARAFPSARLGVIAGSDAIVATAAEKAMLRTRTGAVAADMESHHVALAAAAGVPFAVLRAVSDGAGDDLPRAAQAGFRSDGTTDAPAVLRALIARPGELPALIRTARQAAAGFAALRNAAERLASFPSVPA